MTIVCKINDKQNDIVQILLLDNSLNEALSQTCVQFHFCESLLEMMRHLLITLYPKYNQNITDVECKTEFDLAKHITTYRIFKSFIQGLV